MSFIGFLSFIVSVFVAYPIFRGLGMTFAAAMPRAANVDSQRFECDWREDQTVNGKIAYHTGDNRLTRSEQQTDATAASGPDFQRSRFARAWHALRLPGAKPTP